MSKFLCTGMPPRDVVAASTVSAAMALRRPELGSLKPGSVGDATLISILQGRFDYVDAVGEHLIGDHKIVSEGVVIAGRWWHPKESPKFKQPRVRQNRWMGRPCWQAVLKANEPLRWPISNNTPRSRASSTTLLTVPWAPAFFA